jgi:hypothetical protein
MRPHLHVEPRVAFQPGNEIAKRKKP